MPNTSPEDRMADLEALSEGASHITDEMCDAALAVIGQPPGMHVSRIWIRPGIAAALAIAPPNEHILRMQELADSISEHLEAGDRTVDFLVKVQELTDLVLAPRDAHE